MIINKWTNKIPIISLHKHHLKTDPSAETTLKSCPEQFGRPAGNELETYPQEIKHLSSGTTVFLLVVYSTSMMWYAYYMYTHNITESTLQIRYSIVFVI